MYKHFILFALVILVPGLAFIPWRWPHDIGKTFSQHVADKMSSRIYYVALFSVSLPLVYLFFANYLVPALALPTSILIVVATSCLAQIGCTLVPETGGIKSKIHVTLAGISALLLPVILLIIMRGGVISVLDRMAVGIGTLLMILIAASLMFRNKIRLPALWLQIGYFALFFAALITAAY